jgi:hypothetical protein
MLAMPPPELDPPQRAILRNGRTREVYKRSAVAQDFKDRIRNRLQLYSIAATLFDAESKWMTRRIISTPMSCAQNDH